MGEEAEARSRRVLSPSQGEGECPKGSDCVYNASFPQQVLNTRVLIIFFTSFSRISERFLF